MKKEIPDVASPEGGVPEEKNLSRRDVLRGAVAVGFGLLMPSVLLGCGPKTGTSSTSSSPASSPASPPASTPATSTGSAAPAIAKKVSQASVQYQTQPKGEQKCATCMNFIAESNTCKLVDGQISPDGWCVLWAKKT